MTHPHLFILAFRLLHMDDRGSSDWTVIYLLVLAVIAAILMFGVIKPMYARAGSAVGGAP